MWSRNYTGEAETFVLWSQGGVEICLFLLDQTARMETKKVSTCRGSFGGFETTCFQLDRAASLDSTGMFYFSCDRSAEKGLDKEVRRTKLGEYMVEITRRLLIEHLKSTFRKRCVWNNHIHRSLGPTLM